MTFSGITLPLRILNRKQLINILKYIIFLSLGGVLLYFSLRNVDWADFKEQLVNGRPIYIVAGVLLGLGSHVFRALRWRLLMDAAGHRVTFGYTFASLLVGYGANDLVPRAGEVVRCTMLYRSRKVPVSVGFGTVVTERLTDVLVLGILMLILLGLEGPRIMQIWENLSAMSKSDPADGISIGQVVKYALLGFAAAFVLFVVVFRKRLGQSKFYQKMRTFLLQMKDALKSILRLKSPFLYILYTLSIWVFYVLMTWVPLLAMDSTADIGIYFSVIMLIMGGIGFVFPSPGGTGSYHILVQQAFIAFAPAAVLIPAGMNSADRLSDVGGQAAVVLHASQYVGTLMAGLVAYIWLEINIRKANRQVQEI
jgi:uncharacterized membrane protein YbhN (UPF0104 family)